MLSIKKLIESALECLGWPYVSPGTNDKNGIDCAGLFVKMYKDQGAKIYHGSNTIFREYCSETGKLTSEKQLQPGMAVFKLKAWTDKDKSNRWYGKEPGNLSHIGYVDSVNPLSIIHASSVAKCVTTATSIKNWEYWGKLKAVDYSGEPDPSPSPAPDPDPEPTPIVVEKKVYAENGKPVNLRYGPSLDKKIITDIPVGEIVTLSKIQGKWSKVYWKKYTGWMMSNFLVDPDTPIPEPVPEPEPAPVPDPDPDPDPDIPAGTIGTVWSENGKPVNMRAQPSRSCNLYDKLPVGTEVEIVAYDCTVDAKGNRWTQVNHSPRKGWYIMTKFISLG